MKTNFIIYIEASEVVIGQLICNKCPFFPSHEVW